MTKRIFNEPRCYITELLRRQRPVMGMLSPSHDFSWHVTSTLVASGIKKCAMSTKAKHDS